MGFRWERAPGFESDHEFRHYYFFTPEHRAILHMMWDGNRGVIAVQAPDIRYKIQVIDRKEFSFAMSQPEAWWMEQQL